MENLLCFLSISSGTIWGFVVVFLFFGFCALCYFVLAPNDILFTFGRENRAIYVMYGKKWTGRIILPSTIYYIDKNNNNSIERFDELATKFPNYPANILDQLKEDLKEKSFLGMHWSGLWPFYSIYQRRQQWQEWKIINGKQEIVSRDEFTPFLFVNPFEYAMQTDEAEDKNGVPLDVKFTVIIKPINGVKPIFGNSDAYGQLQRLCITQVLLIVKEQTFETFGSGNSSTAITVDKFSDEVCKLNGTVPGRPDQLGVGDILGYSILDAKLNSVEIVGENKESLLKASTAKYIEEENAKAAVEKAKGQKDVDKLKAEGQEFLNQTQVKFYDDLGKIPGAMDVEKRKATPNVTTLVEGNSKTKPVVPLKP